MTMFSTLVLLFIWGPMAIGTYLVFPIEQIIKVSFNDNTDFITDF